MKIHLVWIIGTAQKKFENTKEVIRSRQSKKNTMVKSKRTNIPPPPPKKKIVDKILHRKLKTPQKAGGEARYSVGVSNFCSTISTKACITTFGNIFAYIHTYIYNIYQHLSALKFMSVKHISIDSNKINVDILCTC